MSDKKNLLLVCLCVLQRHSAVSLRNITTEVLRVLNATEELLQDVEGDSRLPTTSLPPDTDPKKLDQQFSRLEENVSYVQVILSDFAKIGSSSKKVPNILICHHLASLVSFSMIGSKFQIWQSVTFLKF